MKPLKCVLKTICFLSVLTLSLATQCFGTEIIQLDSRRELFVDHFLIEKMTDVELKLHEPSREGIAVKFDRPWEGAFSGYTTVIKDGALYRMYYRGLPGAGRDDSSDAVVCYAESKDGIDWTKPNLRLFEIRGTVDNKSS